MKIDYRNHYVPIVLLSLLLIRVLIFSASVGDSIAFLALSLYTAFSLYNSTRYDKDVHTNINELKELISKSQEELNKIKQINDQLERHRAELIDVRQQLAYSKINKSFQPEQSKQGINPNVGTKKFF